MILILDSNNMAYRARYTHSLSYRGKDTSITFGMLHMLHALLKRHHPRYVIACFDGGTPAFRKRLWPQYKAHRKKDDGIDWSNIYRQIDELSDLSMPLHGIMTIRSRGIEADDLMSQVAQICGDRPYIVSSDNDMLQCVSNSTSIINPAKGIIYDLERYNKDYGFAPEYHLLYKMLCGDSSDNIAGVKGIGDKTAKAMIQRIVEMDFADPYDYYEIEDNIDALPLNKAQKATLLSLGIDTWDAMYEVMDLWTDRSGARIAIAKATWNPADKRALQRYYLDNGFMSLIEDAASTKFARLERPPLWKKWRTPSPMMERGWK